MSRPSTKASRSRWVRWVTVCSPSKVACSRSASEAHRDRITDAGVDHDRVSSPEPVPDELTGQVHGSRAVSVAEQEAVIELRYSARQRRGATARGHPDTRSRSQGSGWPEICEASAPRAGEGGDVELSGYRTPTHCGVADRPQSSGAEQATPLSWTPVGGSTPPMSTRCPATAQPASPRRRRPSCPRTRPPSSRWARRSDGHESRRSSYRP